MIPRLVPVFPNWYPFNDMLIDGHLRIGMFSVKTRSYDWKYRGLVLLYNSGRTMTSCRDAYKYPKDEGPRFMIIGAAELVVVRLLTRDELRLMRGNFNNLTPAKMRAHPELVKVVPFKFGYFFTAAVRFKNPVPFEWKPGPMRPIFTSIVPGSMLETELLASGIVKK